MPATTTKTTASSYLQNTGSMVVLDPYATRNDPRSPDFLPGNMPFYWKTPRPLSIRLHNSVFDADAAVGEEETMDMQNPANLPRAHSCSFRARILGGVLTVTMDNALLIRGVVNNNNRETQLSSLPTAFFNSDCEFFLVKRYQMCQLKHTDILLISTDCREIADYGVQGDRKNHLRAFIFMDEEEEGNTGLTGGSSSRKGKKKKQQKGVASSWWTNNDPASMMQSLRSSLEGFLECVKMVGMDDDDGGVSSYFELSKQDNDARLREPRRLILAMGMHPRLGAKSILYKMLDPCLAELVGAMV